MNPLNSITGSIIVGLILMVIASLVLTAVGSNIGGSVFPNLDRWGHIISGVTWIGLLYYFNVVQTPALAAAGADKGGPGGAGVSKYVAPLALVWFRWAAVVTVLTGAIYLEAGANYGGGSLIKALTFQSPYRTIGLGAWMGIIMLFNVWVLIWPNQKKILGMNPATDQQKASARKIAALASRTNFVLSIPMLMCMGGQSHGLPF